MEPYEAGLAVAPIPLNGVHGRLRFIHKIRVEDVELVTLNDLRRRIIVIVVGLIVLVPLVARMNPVEVLGLPRPILVVPPVHLRAHHRSSTRAKKIYS